MRVLFAAPYVPGPLRTRAFGFIRALHGRGHRVTVCALQTDEASVETLRPFCDAVHIVPHGKARAAWNCARALLTPTPLWAAYCFSPQMSDTLARLCASQVFDVAHIEHLRAASFARALPPALPVVYDAVDCLTDLQEQLMRLPGRSPLSRLVSWEEWIKLRAYEPRVTEKFSHVLCTTPSEADHLQARAGGHLPSLIPITNGVELERNDGKAPYPQGAHVALTGKMSYAPNADAALWFARDVWPAVRRALPHATFIIAGSDPPKNVQKLASGANGIVVTGRVPDLRAVLDAATVAVCPLRAGVGVQNKVLEAMAAGRATVATSRAAAGLLPDALPPALRVADRTGEFAEAVIDLLQHPSLAEEIGRAGRAYVERQHGWDTCAEQLEAVYRMAKGTA